MYDYREKILHCCDIYGVLTPQLYSRDDLVVTILALADAVSALNPTSVVCLGEQSVVSLGALQDIAPSAIIHAVGTPLKAVQDTAHFYPVDVSRVITHEGGVRALDFSSLWSNNETVLLVVSAHALPDVVDVDHVIHSVLPFLPHGSAVVVEGVWFNAERIKQDAAQSFMMGSQLSRIDELQCFDGYYAPYHEGGSLFGCLKVKPFFDFINNRRISFEYPPEGKHVWFAWDGEMHAAGTLASFQLDPSEHGEVSYDPLNIDSPFPLTQRTLGVARRLYRSGQIRETVALLYDLVKGEHCAEACLALAICFARFGDLLEARNLASTARRMNSGSPRVERLCRDLDRRLGIKDFPQSGNGGVTIYAAPKAFTGHSSIIQKNAIRSWARLTPRPEIILLGDEEGIAEMAQEVNALHIPDLARNEFGTPLLDDLIYTATSMARNNTLAYVNSDIILFDDFMSGIAKARAVHNEMLLIGRRWDMNVVEEINFDDPGWRQTLLDDVAKNGFLHFETGIDYFVHNKGLWVGMPPFALGRCAWDNWLVGNPLSMDKAVIDTTEYITAIHQDHGYAHGGGRKKVFEGVEAQRNRAMAQSAMGFTSDAVLYMTSEGKIVSRAPLPALHRSPQAISDRVRWLVIQANRLQNRGYIELAIFKYEEASRSEPDNCRLAEVLHSLRERQTC